MKALSVHDACDDGHADPDKRCRTTGCVEHVHRPAQKGVYGSYCQKHATERVARGRRASAKPQGAPRDTELVRAARRLERLRKNELVQKERATKQLEALQELRTEIQGIQAAIKAMIEEES